MTRTPTGQFPRGVSGNPKGRPPRARNDAAPPPGMPALTGAGAAPTAVTRRDGWINSATGHGTSRDRRTLTRYGVDIVTDLEAQQLRRSEFLAAKIIEDEPKQALSRGWHLKCEDKELDVAICKQAEALGLDEILVDAWSKENEAGGAAIFPVLSGALGDLSQPLDEGAIASVDAFHIFEPQELTPAAYYMDIRDPKWRKPSAWRLTPLSSGRTGFTRTEIIHETRLVVFPGVRVSEQTQPGQREGWGDSLLCRPWSVISDFGLAWGSAATLLQNHGKETLEMKGLADMMAQADGLVEFDRYLEAMWSAWSTLRMNVVDSESRISRSTGTLSGVSDVLREFKSLMAAACNRPVSILMGDTQTGLRTGDDDTRSWYATVERDRSKHLKPRHERIIKLMLLATAGPTNGTEPDAWGVDYPSLWAPSEKEVAETRKLDMDRAVAAVESGIASSDDVAESFYGGDTYSGDIVINWERRKAQTALQSGPGDMTDEDMAAVGADGAPLNDEERSQLEALRSEFGTEDDEEPLSDDEPEDDFSELDDVDEDDDREDEDDVWREDATAVGPGGKGYNPYRDKGKFASGPHKKPTPAERHAAAAAKYAALAGKAKGRASEHAWKAKIAKEAHGAASVQARTALRKAAEAAELAKQKPTAKNIKAAQVATNKATRAAAKANKHEAAIAKHTAPHEKATAAHGKAVDAHKKATERHEKAKAKEKAQAAKAEKTAPKPASLPPATPKKMSSEAYSEWQKKATDENPRITHGEREALRDYSGESYKAINGAHRMGHEPKDPDHAKTSKLLDSAIAKSGAPHDMLVYRGIANTSIVGTLKAGDVFHDKAFLSTTTNSTVAHDNFANGGAVFHITVRKGSKALPMTKNGLYPEEKEVLLPRGTQMYIKKVEINNHGTVIIHAEALHDPATE